MQGPFGGAAFSCSYGGGRGAQRHRPEHMLQGRVWAELEFSFQLKVLPEIEYVARSRSPGTTSQRGVCRKPRMPTKVKTRPMTELLG